MNWFLRDKYGWPIERIKGRPIENALRVVFLNIKKVAHLGSHLIGWNTGRITRCPATDEITFVCGGCGQYACHTTSEHQLLKPKANCGTLGVSCQTPVSRDGGTIVLTGPVGTNCS